MIALALILSDGGANVTGGILLNFLFYVIITPVIATTMQKVMFMSEGSMTVADALDRIDSVLDRKPFENSGKKVKHPTIIPSRLKTCAFPMTARISLWIT